MSPTSPLTPGRSPCPASVLASGKWGYLPGLRERNEIVRGVYATDGGQHHTVKSRIKLHQDFVIIVRKETKTKP